MTQIGSLFKATAMPDRDWWQALWPDPARVLREIRAKYLGSAVPASTLVEIKKLANDAFLVEIEVVAVCAK